MGDRKSTKGAKASPRERHLAAFREGIHRRNLETAEQRLSERRRADLAGVTVIDDCDGWGLSICDGSTSVPGNSRLAVPTPRPTTTKSTTEIAHTRLTAEDLAFEGAAFARAAIEAKTPALMEMLDEIALAYAEAPAVAARVKRQRGAAITNDRKGPRYEARDREIHEKVEARAAEIQRSKRLNQPDAEKMARHEIGKSYGINSDEHMKRIMRHQRAKRPELIWTVQQKLR